MPQIFDQEDKCLILGHLYVCLDTEGGGKNADVSIDYTFLLFYWDHELLNDTAFTTESWFHEERHQSNIHDFLYIFTNFPS